MTILFLISVSINIYLFILHKQQATALDSLQGLDGMNQATISKLRKDTEASNKKAQSFRHRKKTVIKTIQPTN